MSPQLGVDLTALIVSCWHIWFCLEALIALRSGQMRLLTVAVAVDHAPQDVPIIRSARVVAIGLTIRAVASLALLLWFVAAGAIAWPCLALTSLCALHYAWFRIVGGDGSEQMALIVTVAVTLCTSPLQVPGGDSLALAFIGSQCLLAYFSAGIAKLPSEAWRSGRAIQGIMATESHGSRTASAILRHHPWIGKLLSWLTVALEIGLPVAALTSIEGAVVLVVAGGAFHASCAFLMGLNSFPLAFLATYPGVLYLSGVCSTWSVHA